MKNGIPRAEVALFETPEIPISHPDDIENAPFKPIATTQNQNAESVNPKILDYQEIISENNLSDEPFIFNTDQSFDDLEI